MISESATDGKKVALYGRVSTNSQDLDNQLYPLRTYAHKQGWTIWYEYADIVSGKETSRPGWDRMFLDAHKRLFDIVLFWDLSRFSRSGTLYTLQKLQELTSSGIEWKSYQEQYLDSTGQFKDVVIAIMATLAKLEREKIQERTFAGLQRVRCKCGHVRFNHDLDAIEPGCTVEGCACGKFRQENVRGRGK